jgi:hypothetical protein
MSYNLIPAKTALVPSIPDLFTKKIMGQKMQVLDITYFTNYTYQARYNEVLLGKLNLMSSSLSFSKTLLQCQGVHHHQLLKQQTQHTSPFQ